jgi:hypothetical protein
MARWQPKLGPGDVSAGKQVCTSCMRITHAQHEKKFKWLPGKEFAARFFNPQSFQELASSPPRDCLSSALLTFLPPTTQFPTASKSLKMSPIAAAATPGSASMDYKKESTLARLLGSGIFFQTSQRSYYMSILTRNRICWHC